MLKYNVVNKFITFHTDHINNLYLALRNVLCCEFPLYWIKTNTYKDIKFISNASIEALRIEFPKRKCIMSLLIDY